MLGKTHDGQCTEAPLKWENPIHYLCSTDTFWSLNLNLIFAHVHNSLSTSQKHSNCQVNYLRHKKDVSGSQVQSVPTVW